MNEGYQLRPYQHTFIDAIKASFKKVRRVLAILPGGGGKTICFSALAEQYLPGKTLILAGTNELIQQACDKLQRSTGIIPGLEKAESDAYLSDQVVVSSIQTMCRRLDKWPKDHFSLVVADEAHQYMADSPRKILDHFSGAHILGVTATGFRNDNRELKDLFDEIAIEITLKELVLDGYLAPIRIRTLPLNIDLIGVRQNQGDFDTHDLDDRLTPHLKAVAEAIKQYAGDRKTLVFVPLIKTSEAFVEVCKPVGLTAQHIDGKSEYRKGILDDFKAGKFQVMCNSSLLTTGYDEPSINCVVMLRPTRSRVLYNQAILRGSRIHPGKEDLLVLDPIFLSDRFSLINAASLICTNEDQLKVMTKTMRKPGAARDLLGIESDVALERELALKKEIEANRKRRSALFDPLNFSTTVHNMDLADYTPRSTWEFDAPTKPQLDCLSNWKFDVQQIKTKGQASAIIGFNKERMNKGLASPKQLFHLKKYGCPNLDTITKDEASRYLDIKWGKA